MSSRVIGFRVPDDLAVELERVSSERGMTTADFLRKLVDDTLYPPSGERASTTTDRPTKVQLDDIEDTQASLIDELNSLSNRVDKLQEAQAKASTDKALSSAEISMLDDAANVAKKVDELKASHNRLREGYEKLIPWLHNLEDKLNSVDGLKESVNDGLGKLEREVGDLRSKLQPLTALPSKVETVKSDVVRLSDRVAIAERRAKQKPTDDIKEIEFKNGKTHKFRVYKSTDGLVKPHTVTWDPISGNKYVDLSEPLD